MEGRVVILLILSGLWFLPACFPRKYILVEKAKTWFEAQSYCREKYTDLATVESQEEMDELLASTEDSPEDHLWIGLRHEMTPWKWSLEDDSYYAEEEKEFRMWESGEPNKSNHDCVTITSTGFWLDLTCGIDRQFVCSTVSGFVYVPIFMIWKDAQTYCRENHIDLASVRNQADNDLILALVNPEIVWIGLSRGQWKWSDGTPLSFREWKKDPANGVNSVCGTLRHGNWKPAICSNPYFFVCYTNPVKKQVVKIRVTQKDSSGNLEDAAEAILQEMRQKLKQRGLSEDVKLSWRKQPDGRIFVPEEEEEKRKHDEL